MLAQHSEPHSLRGELLWPPGKLLLVCVMASLGTGRKQPAPSALKIAEHYGHTLVFEGKNLRRECGHRRSRKGNSLAPKHRLFLLMESTQQGVSSAPELGVAGASTWRMWFTMSCL